MKPIDSPANEKVKEVSLLLKSAEARRGARRFVAEGVKLTAELPAGVAIESLWLTPSARARYGEELKGALRRAGEVYEIGERVEKKLSSQATPQGVVAVCELPEFKAPNDLLGARRVAALCSLRDPLNVGAALRSAAAFGYDVLLSADCADCFSPKALRSSMGAGLYCNLALAADMPSALAAFTAAGVLTLAATPRADAAPPGEIDHDRAILVAIGNESRGLSEAESAGCAGAVTIEQNNPNVDSLNAAVAAGILLYELRAKGKQ